jgi:hypothetical protein
MGVPSILQGGLAATFDVRDRESGVLTSKLTPDDFVRFG